MKSTPFRSAKDIIHHAAQDLPSERAADGPCRAARERSEHFLRCTLRLSRRGALLLACQLLCLLAFRLGPLLGLLMLEFGLFLCGGGGFLLRSLLGPAF